MTASARTILLADDDSDVRRLLSLHLKEEGWAVLEARNGALALETLLVERPDVVILDVMMPELTGWEVLKYIRTHDELQATPVLMLTGIGESLNAATSPMFGADAYLDKPFELDDIDARLQEIAPPVSELV